MNADLVSFSPALQCPEQMLQKLPFAMGDFWGREITVGIGEMGDLLEKGNNSGDRGNGRLVGRREITAMIGEMRDLRGWEITITDLVSFSPALQCPEQMLQKLPFAMGDW